MVIKKRLIVALAESGKIQADIARFTGVSTAGVNLWFKNDGKKNITLKHDNLVKVAECLDVDPEWLTGKASNKQLPKSVISNSRNTREGISKIPIVNMEDVGLPAQYQYDTKNTSADQWVLTIDTDNAEIFPVNVTGSSMAHEGSGISYPNGSIIFCDPTIAHDVKVGDDVIARLYKDNTRVFKSYDIIDGKPALVPLNRQYPVMLDEFEVLAVVVQVTIKRVR